MASAQKILNEDLSNDGLTVEMRFPRRSLTQERFLYPNRGDASRAGQAPLKNIEGAPNFIVVSAAMRELMNRVGAVANSQVPVLITGETGTGKELLARAVHTTGHRLHQKFLPFNCATLVRETAESQIFGHKRGSFTGALNDYQGIIRAADGGTLFLDEIGELGLELQPKLLRFLQEGEVQPLGATGPVKTNARVVAATNLDLEEEVRAGRFRRDLFHRLKVIHLRIPPLRERREEIPYLIEYYLERYRVELKKPGLALSGEAMRLLMRHDWPGNVRELCHELQRMALYVEAGRLIDVDQLDPAIAAMRESRCGTDDQITPKIKLLVEGDVTLAEAVSELERQLIVRALSRHKGNLTRAARSLRLTNKGMRDKMRRLDINRAGPLYGEVLDCGRGLAG